MTLRIAIKKLASTCMAKWLWLSLLALLLLGLMDVRVASAQQLVWTRQFGTLNDDFAVGVAVYGSSVYVVGSTFGVLPGQTNKGYHDAFVRKYDAYGNLKWTRQFGTPSNDVARGVAVYGSSVYVVGSTSGAFPGQTNKGSIDAFVRKYDAYGNLKWTQQFGTPSFDEVGGVAVYGSSIYVVGTTYGIFSGQTSKGEGDAFVRKYDAYGNLKWTRQFGTPSNDFAEGVAVYGSSVYVVGSTFGVLPGQTNKGGYDAFVRKYDAYGNVKWTRQFGTSGEDYAYGVAVYGSSVYVVGRTMGAFSGQTSKGVGDAFVRKYDAYGNVKWTRQFGTSSDDLAVGVAVYSSSIYVVGITEGAFSGQTSKGVGDAFVRKYDAYGNVKWTRQFGTSAEDDASSVAVNYSGVYVAGDTEGALPGQTKIGWGGSDAFVCKYAL